MATMQMSRPAQANNCHCDQAKQPIITQNNGGCKPDDQKKQPITQNNGACKSPEKKHQLHFWQRWGGEHKNEHNAINKHHPEDAKLKPNTVNKHQLEDVKPKHDAAIKHPLEEAKPKHNAMIKNHPEEAKHKLNALFKHNPEEAKPMHHNEPKKEHKLTQCFGPRHQMSFSDDDEETEIIVIDRKIKERVKITHIKKSIDHKEAEKHLDRC